MTMVGDEHGVRQLAATTRLDSRVAVLIGVVAVLALAASVAGLAIDGVYTGARSTAEILRGYDLVTAVVVVPALGVAALQAWRGSLLGQLVTAGLLADLVYGYAFYVFGTGFNDLFLLHVAVFSASLTALVLTIAGLDVAAVAERFRGVRHVWPAAVALGLLAVSLGGMWVWAAVANAVTGTVPVGSSLVETTEVLHLGMVLDLAVQVPLYAAAAVLVWRRTGWGYVLAFVALVSGIPEQLSYLVAMPFQVMAGVPDAVALEPLEPVIVALYALGLIVLLSGRR
ncbi:MAG: hypothetical protein L0H79_15025 [Intrasporangium sp.]|uniref:hypothetical protein n=1 Tax=Intrasporangium sp. TaxID=1925024 RepID=UPI0026485340|nr:hypothetical protein [Intrasporangium sp.]MDN5797053.1 hypothetical protein [Intrasporangium sp.]